MTLPPIKVGHFNTYLLSRIAAKFESGQWVEALATLGRRIVTLGIDAAFEEEPARTDKIIDRILDADYDVVCLNEVFDTAAAAQFLARLQNEGHYGYVLYNLGAGLLPINTENDLWDANGPLADVAQALAPFLGSSGLLLASRYPFVPFTGPGTDGGKVNHRFVQFDRAGGWDALAPKGAVAAAIKVPDMRPIVVTATHLQADDGDTTYPRVRHRQIEQWMHLVAEVRKATDALAVIGAGDLNIDGAMRPDGSFGAEYTTQFNQGRLAGTNLVDLWHRDHSPTDPLLTSEEWKPDATVERKRLDYILASDESDMLLVAQHLMKANNLRDGQPLLPTPLANLTKPARGGPHALSDHDGLNALLGQRPAYGTVRTAREVQLIGSPGVAIYPLQKNRALESCTWFRLPDPGTYFVKAWEQEILLFADTDLSTGLTPMPPSDWDHLWQRKLGSRFVAPTAPMYVRLRKIDTSSSPLEVGFLRANGQDRRFAILLWGWERTDAAFPVGQVLGAEDAMWFEIWLDQATAEGVEQDVHLSLEWDDTQPTGIPPFMVQVLDETEQVLHTVAPSGPGEALRWTTRGGQVLFVKIYRRTPQAPAFAVTWGSNLTLLHGASYAGHPVPETGPLQIVAEDETGADWSGSDEVRLRLSSDGATHYERVWDDSEALDSGDSRAVELTGIAFVHPLAVQVSELEEGSDQHGRGELALPRWENVSLRQRLHLGVGGGDYGFYYNLSRYRRPW